MGGRRTQSQSRAMSARAALLRACCLLALVAGSRQFSIKEFMVPVAVQLGEAAELRCLYKLSSNETEDALYVKWWWSPSESMDDRKHIYQRIAGLPAEVIHNKDRIGASKIVIKEHDTIVLANVSPADSGAYECEVSNIEEIRQHAPLTVFSMGTGPKVNYTISDDTSTDDKDELLIDCAAENVAPTPDLIVTINGEAVNTTEYTNDTDGDGFSTIHASAALSLKDLETSEIRCELVYINPSIAHQPYVDVTTYVPAGGAETTTEPPDAVPEPPATPDSLQNPSDDGIRLQSSLILLAGAVLLTQLHISSNLL